MRSIKDFIMEGVDQWNSDNYCVMRHVERDYWSDFTADEREYYETPAAQDNNTYRTPQEALTAAKAYAKDECDENYGDDHPFNWYVREKVATVSGYVITLDFGECTVIYEVDKQ